MESQQRTRKEKVWFRERNFWIGWFIHAVIAFVVAWVVIGPIFRLTFQNGSIELTDLQLAYWISVYLVGIWLLQLITLKFYPSTSRKIQWLIVLGAYFQISPPIVAAFCLVRRWSISKPWLRLLLIMFISLIFWIILRELVLLYSVVVGELFFRVIR